MKTNMGTIVLIAAIIALAVGVLVWYIVVARHSDVEYGNEENEDDNEDDNDNEDGKDRPFPGLPERHYQDRSS